MTTYAERSDALCDKLRDLEHQAQDGDQLFYCAYLLGLLGLHSAAEGEGADQFDAYFETELKVTLEAEKVSEKDQEAILALWNQVSR
ncbi:YfcL family protein [Marinomonas fungiae]|uniref:YfcL protein n=1 Tax=Marinomonas fungiae TaxID=1137284 RepID=A0A0K6IIB5_9GAMM|nr:YfcL family protein [Marinomonas fungiae]CUB02811.1 YfcL protein [Marinomonas fungiae]